MLSFHVTPLLAANISGFAIWKATPEGKATMSALVVLSLSSVIVRGDSMTKYNQIRAVLDAGQQANIAKVDLATEAADKK